MEASAPEQRSRLEMEKGYGWAELPKTFLGDTSVSSLANWTHFHLHSLCGSRFYFSCGVGTSRVPIVKVCVRNWDWVWGWRRFYLTKTLGCWNWKNRCHHHSLPCVRWVLGIWENSFLLGPQPLKPSWVPLADNQYHDLYGLDNTQLLSVLNRNINGRANFLEGSCTRASQNAACRLPVRELSRLSKYVNSQVPPFESGYLGLG